MNEYQKKKDGEFSAWLALGFIFDPKVCLSDSKYSHISKQADN